MKQRLLLVSALSGQKMS